MTQEERKQRIEQIRSLVSALNKEHNRLNDEYEQTEIDKIAQEYNLFPGALLALTDDFERWLVESSAHASKSTIWRIAQGHEIVLDQIKWYDRERQIGICDLNLHGVNRGFPLIPDVPFSRVLEMREEYLHQHAEENDHQHSSD